jgi:pimeloyl-ACP methyl ester carboxylesterase
VLAVREHYPAEPVTLVGESLGSGVAVQVAAALMKKPARLVLLTPFVSLVDIARKVFPWVPVELLLRHRFESNRQLLEYKGPVSVLIAGRDEVLGADQGRALGAIAHSRGPTAVVEIAEASHSDWCDRITESQWSELLTTTPTPLAA